jgi:hypothetical protein
MPNIEQNSMPIQPVVIERRDLFSRIKNFFRLELS